MNYLRSYFIFILFIIFSSLIIAQNSVDIEKTLIISYAYGDDVQLHHKALDSIQTRYRRNGVIEDEIKKIVFGMAESSIRRETYEDGVLIKTDHDVQLKAIQLLGELGGQDSLDSLTQLLLLSTNQPILLESIYSSSILKAQNYDEYLAAMVHVMENQHYRSMDNGFAYAAVTALDNITDNTDVMLTPDIIKILLLYSSSGYIQSVRDYSRVLLKKY